MLDVHVLGSGNGLPGRLRDTSGYAIEAPDGWTLVDCPGGVVAKLARIGVGVDDLQRVILTHDHVDHVYGLPHLLHARQIAGIETALAIHAPAETLATIRRVVAAFGLPGDGEAFVGHAVAARHGETVLSGPLEVRATPASHTRPTIALRVAAGGAVWGHSSDTLANPALTELCRRVDLMTHDCGGLEAERASFGAHHASAAEAGRAARGAEARALALVHLPDLETAPAEELRAEAAREFDGPVTLAHDGTTYRLGPGSPTHGGRLR